MLPGPWTGHGVPWSSALAGSCDVKHQSLAGLWALGRVRTQTPGRSQAADLGLHFPNLRVLPKQILPFPRQTSLRTPMGAAPSVPLGVRAAMGCPRLEGPVHPLPRDALGAVKICGLSCLVLIQF